GCERTEARGGAAAARSPDRGDARWFLTLGATCILMAILGREAAAAIGGVLVFVALVLWIMRWTPQPDERPTLAIPAPPREVPVPFAGPARAPIHGVEILQQVLNRPVLPPPRPEDLRDPVGPTTACPSCARPLEAAQDL